MGLSPLRSRVAWRVTDDAVVVQARSKWGDRSGNSEPATAEASSRRLLETLDVLCEAIEEVLAGEKSHGKANSFRANERRDLLAGTFELENVIPESFTEAERSSSRSWSFGFSAF